jgi:hypothetical protein
MKNKTEHKILFGPGGCLTRETIHLFIDGKLTDDELKKVHHHTKRCQLCADSLEGALLFPSGSTFSTRVSSLHHSNFRRSLDKNGRSRKFFYGITSTAASIALLFGIIYIFQLQRVVREKDEIAEKNEPQSEINSYIPAADSVVIVDISPETESKTVAKPLDKEQKRIESEQAPAIPARPKGQIVIKESDVQLDDETIYFDEPELLTPAPKTKIKEMEKKKALSAQQEMMSMGGASEALPDLSTREPKQTNKREAQAEVYSPREQRARRVSRKADKINKSAYYVAEVMPMFNGGDVNKFSEYIADSLKVILPDSILAQSIVVGFRIDTSGNVDKIHLISGTDSEVLNNQVLDIIRNSPQWIPASISGKPVESEQEVKIVLGK